MRKPSDYSCQRLPYPLLLYHIPADGFPYFNLLLIENGLGSWVVGRLIFIANQEQRKVARALVFRLPFRSKIQNIRENCKSIIYFITLKKGYCNLILRSF